MKAIMFAVGLMLGGVGGSAIAATYLETAEAYQLADELRYLRELRDIQGADVLSLTCTAETNQGTKVVSFSPTDTGWSTLLSRLKTAVTDRIATIKTRLGQLQITEVPE